MTEQRATYQAGPLAIYKTTCNYQITWRGSIEGCEAKFSVQANSALEAAEEALAMVKAAAGPHPVTNLVLHVSLDL